MKRELMWPDLTSFALFLKAVETGSLSRAAEQSHLVLSAASRRIASLEDQYGVALLNRVRGGVDPTVAGLALAAHVGRVFREIDLLKVEMSDHASGGKGRVRLYANPAEVSQTLPDRLAEFIPLHPKIQVELREQSSVDIVAAIRDRSADIGIITAGVRAEGLVVRSYRTDRLCLLVPRNCPIRARSVSFSQVVSEDFVGLDKSPAFTQLLDDAAAQAGVAMRWRVHVSSYESMCRLIRAGLGIGVISEGVAEVFRRAMDLRAIRLRDNWAERHMQIVTLHEESPAPTRLLIQHLLSQPT